MVLEPSVVLEPLVLEPLALEPSVVELGMEGSVPKEKTKPFASSAFFVKVGMAGSCFFFFLN